MMKKFLVCIWLCALLICFLPMSAYAGLSPSLWDTYYQMAVNRPVAVLDCPGRVLCDRQNMSEFIRRWKCRGSSYELHYKDRAELARTVYDLAVHAGDIDASVSRERVEAGVEGFHYSSQQVCAWIEEVLHGASVSREAMVFIGYLLYDGVIVFDGGRCKPGAGIRHVLAAAPGKKRSFKENIDLERLHVLWDEDPSFRAKAQAAWAILPEPDKVDVQHRLRAYANDLQLRLEEWAVREVEQKKLDIEGTGL